MKTALLNLYILLTLSLFSVLATADVADVQERLNNAKTIEALDERQQALLALRESVLQQSDNSLIFDYWRQLAIAQNGLGRFEAAEKSIKNLHQAAFDTNVIDNQGIAHFEQGQVLRNWGRYLDAMKPYELALPIFQASNNYQLQSRTLRQLAYCQRSIGNYEEANRYIESSLSLANLHGLEIEKSHAITAKARLLSIMGLYQEALTYQLSQLSSNVYSNYSLARKASTLYAIGESYRRIADYPISIEYFKKAYEIDLSLNNQIDIGHSQIKLAQTHWRIENFDEAMFYAKSALDTFNKTKVERHIAWAHSNIGDIHLAKKEFKTALDFLLKSENTLSQLEEQSLLASVRLSMASAYLGLTNFNEAEKWANKALAFGTKTNRLSTQIDANEILVRVYEQNKRFEQALNAQKALQAINTQYIKQKHSYRTAYLKSSLDHATKDIEIVELKSNQEKQARVLEQQKANSLQAIGVAIIALLLFVLLLFFFISRRKLYLLKQKLLADAIEKRNQLFTDISHELRTPLSVLKLQLQAMEYEIEEDIEKGYAKLHEKISELDLLINDIYQLSSIESQALSLSLEKTDICHWYQNQQKEWQHLIQSNDLHVTITNEVSDQPRYVAIDGMRFKQVLLNIISNSIKYTDKPGELKIALQQVRNKVQITISDSAPGVDKSALPKLFDRFYRTDSSRSRDSGGSGLGLSIAQGIVTLHNGSIRAQQSPLGGLTISIRLPILSPTQ